MKFAVIFGGMSFEHEISIVSAISLSKIIDIEHFIFIDEQRDFYLIDKQNLKAKFFSSYNFKKEKKLNIEKNGFSYKTVFGKKELNFDILINLVHGNDGEDGKLASIFEFFDINFIGPRIEASVISFNKFFTKLYAKAIDVNTLEYKYFKLNQDIKINNFPVIIKPTKLGSSIGISIVKEENELSYALDIAREFCDEVIIEPFVSNIKEYNLAGCKITDNFIFSNIEEVSKNEYLDFEKKYLDFNREKKVKSTIPQELDAKLKDTFKNIYNNLFEGSLIRCDFFVINNEVYLNEINPIPGSYANYLFDDFKSVFLKLASNLPKSKKINIHYEYINKINANKGK